MTLVHQWRKMNYHVPFSLLRQLPRICIRRSPDSAPFFNKFSHSGSTVALAFQVSALLEASELVCARYEWILFPANGPHEFLVQRFPYVTSWIPLLPRYTSILTCDHRFCYGFLRAFCHSCFKKAYQVLLGARIFSVHLWWSLCTPRPSVRWNKYLEVFGLSRALFFHSPNCCFSFMYVPWHTSPTSTDRALMLLAVWSSHRTTCICLEAFPSMRWVWTLSMNRTNLLTHQCTNNHRSGFLAKHLKLYGSI